MWEIVKGIVGMLCVVAFFIGLMVVGNAWEEHQLCMNGAIEHCIPEDFN